jgi:hypothetical protein
VGKILSWRLGAITGLFLALVLATVSFQAVRVSADPGDNGATGSGSGDPGIQVAVPISTVWNEFLFGGPGSFATGCIGAGCVPGANSVFVGAPPWTFTAPAGGVVLQVTDAFLIGDEFRIYDFGVSIGTTDGAANTGDCGANPDPCFATAAVSQGSFNLGPGNHSITIQAIDSPFGGGAAYFRVIPAPSVCTLTQSLTIAGGNVTWSITGTSTPARQLVTVLFLGTTAVPIPLGAVGPGAYTFGPITFPLSGLGDVGFLSYLVGGTDICAFDVDIVNTGSPAAGTTPQLAIPELNGVTREE